jgi:hypothetical protein
MSHSDLTHAVLSFILADAVNATFPSLALSFFISANPRILAPAVLRR